MEVNNFTVQFPNEKRAKFIGRAKALRKKYIRFLCLIASNNALIAGGRRGEGEGKERKRAIKTDPLIWKPNKLAG